MATMGILDAPLLKSINTTFLDEPPACILIAPTDPSLIIVGTYLYEPEIPRKSGSLLLYKWSTDNSSLELLDSHATHAILDAKFSPHDPTYIATGQSNGVYQSFRLLFDPPSLKLVHNTHLLSPDRLLLSVSWHPTSDDGIACTVDNGLVQIFKESMSQQGSMICNYNPHEAEAWTCEFSPDGRTLYSGGDDSVFRAHDVETGQMLWRDRKSHGAGVTAIMARLDHTLLTGSYDDILRVWDLRTQKAVAQLNLGGGVWRLADRGSNSVVASCMYAGARVVDLSPSGTSPHVVARFEEHESMNYGCAVHLSDPDTVVSCSFYDKRLCIWSTEKRGL